MKKPRISFSVYVHAVKMQDSFGKGTAPCQKLFFNYLGLEMLILVHSLTFLSSNVLLPSSGARELEAPRAPLRAPPPGLKEAPPLPPSPPPRSLPRGLTVVFGPQIQTPAETRGLTVVFGAQIQLCIWAPNTTVRPRVYCLIFKRK